MLSVLKVYASNSLHVRIASSDGSVEETTTVIRMLCIDTSK
jgi:hypothetical protein